MNTAFRRQSFIAGLCVFMVLLFGGVTVKQNSLALGTTTCQAVTVSRPSAKEKVARKGHRLYNRILKKWSRRDGGFAGATLIPFVMVGSGILGIVFGIWAVNLLIVGNLIGLLVGFVGLVSFALFLFLLFNFFI